MDEGKVFHSTLFVFKAIKTSGISRFSVIVSKKVAKTAVERNKIRRRLYSLLNSGYSEISRGVHGIFIVKNDIKKVSVEELATTLDQFFVKIGLLK